MMPSHSDRYAAPHSVTRRSALAMLIAAPLDLAALPAVAATA